MTRDRIVFQQLGLAGFLLILLALAPAHRSAPQLTRVAASGAPSSPQLPAPPVIPVPTVASPPLATTTSAATVTPPTRATPTPPAIATSAVRATPRVAANELGKIMVLEYHEIRDPELRWRRTPQNFRRDLAYLYAHDYYLTPLTDLIEDRVRVPAGKSPVVLTFDDSNRSQFQFRIGAGGGLEVDPESGLGILDRFAAEHPGFGRAAVFCVLPGAEAPNDLFGQPEYRAAKLRYLAANGYEICNHTLWHANLLRVDDREIVRQLALATRAIQDAVPGYRVSIFNPPGGVYPKRLGLIVNGSFEGTAYHHRAILEVGAGPMSAPDDIGTDFLRLPRIQAISTELDTWFGRFEQHPEERYVSDGDPDRLTIPTRLWPRYRPRMGARPEEPSDRPYRLVRLR